LCVGLDACNSQGLECSACLAYLEGSLTSADPTDLCVAGASQSDLTQTCIAASHDTSVSPPQCAQ
jgi:hypothetical protein